MLKKIVLILGGLMLAAGLLGFFVPNFVYLVQFDLSQSLIYSLMGVAGVGIGTTKQTNLVRQRYLSFLAIINFLLLMLGLTFPNWSDIMHLEVPEHFFHGGVGIIAALFADHYRKKV